MGPDVGHQTLVLDRGSLVKRSADDAKTSLAVRRRAKFTCERCKRQHDEHSMGLHAAHLFTRSIKATRHDMDNLAALCWGCHAYFHRQPLECHDWWKERLGEERYTALMQKAKRIK